MRPNLRYERSSSKAVGKEPCPKCQAIGEDTSGDNLIVFDDGHKHCFACNHHVNNKSEGEISNVEYTKTDTTVSVQYTDYRGISAATFRKFGVPVEVGSDGTPMAHRFKYPKGVKFRTYDQKKFSTHGDMSSGQLFGQNLFEPGTANAITIVEGEFDALSVYEMLGSKYPVVSVRSSSSAKRDCTDQYEYLNSFEKIYLALDNDGPGLKAAKEVAALFDYNKIYVVNLGQYKDANDILQKGQGAAFTKMWWNAKKFVPDNIVATYAEIDDIIDNDRNTQGVAYPWDKLNWMTYGIHLGEFILVTALEGIGKTEVLRSFEHQILSKTDDNIGIIHLEEGKARAVKGLAGLHLKQPVHLPDTMVSNDEIKKAYRELTKRDGRVHLYTHFGSDDPDTILGTIQYLIGPAQCKYIFFDHITMAVTGNNEQDERQALDYLSTRLKTMTETHDVAIFCVSHVNDEGKTRGSRNISKVANLWLHLDRDIESPDEEVRNTTNLLVRKARLAGRTGPAGKLLFDPKTYLLNEVKEVQKEEGLPF